MTIIQCKTAVFAGDPGLRSGWATWKYDKTEMGIDDPMPLVDRLYDWCSHRAYIGRERESLIVFESYTITQGTVQKSQQHYSLELIGAARWLAHNYSIEFVLQSPRDAKRFCPDERLKQLGLYTPGKEDHARDASRHLVLALAKRGLIQVSPL